MHYLICFILSIFVTNACDQHYSNSKFLGTIKLCPEDIFEEHLDNKSIPYQGWKIYVSATLDSMETIKKLVEPTLVQLNISYKVIKSREIYEQFNSNKEEQGKYFTIYPRDYEEAFKISHVLNLVLTTLVTDKFMKIPYAMPLGKSGGLFTRYGQFKYGFPMKEGHVLVVLKEDQFLNCSGSREIGQIILKYNKQFQVDDRKVVFPDFIEMSWLPFGNLSKIF